MSMPALTRAATRSGALEAGPIVQTILARRPVAARGAAGRPSAGVERSRVSVIAPEPKGASVSDGSRACEGPGNSAGIAASLTRQACGTGGADGGPRSQDGVDVVGLEGPGQEVALGHVAAQPVEGGDLVGRLHP